MILQRCVQEINRYFLKDHIIIIIILCQIRCKVITEVLYCTREANSRGALKAQNFQLTHIHASYNRVQ